MFDSSSFVPELPSACNGRPPQVITQQGHAAHSASVQSAQARGTSALSAAPRIVTTGGKFSSPENPSTPSHLAIVDFLAFTIVPPSDDPLGWLFPYLTDLFGISALLPKNKGAAGYKTSYDMNGHGLLALGGKGQRGTVLVSLTGKGCTRINNWPAVQYFLESHCARLKRVDVAHDDLQGESLNIESAVLWYHGGGFNSGGRTPEHNTRGDWLTPGSPNGRTLYVGNRANGKYCRIYEKGKQLGNPVSPWVRGEVEFKDERRVLPYDMLTRPSHYLAGAYPCFAYLNHAQEKIKTITKAVNISYDAAVHHARQVVGRLVHVMMQMNGGDAFAVINELKREGVPRRLKNYADFLPQIIEGGSA